MDKIGSRQFATNWRTLNEPVEVFNRDAKVGTWIPASANAEAAGWRSLESESYFNPELSEARADLDAKAPPVLREVLGGRERAKRADQARLALLRGISKPKNPGKPQK